MPQLATAAALWIRINFSAYPTKRSSPLLSLEGEIGRCRRASGDSHFLILGAGGFLPRSHRIVSRWHVIDGEIATVVGGRVRTFYHNEPTVHPGMDVALYLDRLRSLPALLDRRRSRRLRPV